MEIRYFLLILIAFSAQVKAAQYSYVGFIKFPSSLAENERRLSLYYKGACIDTKDASYIFNDEWQEKFNILVTHPDNIKYHTVEENNITTQELTKHARYKFFELIKKNTAKENQSYTWDIREIPLNAQQEKLIIPLNTLIVPLEPEYIPYLENNTWKRTTVVKLPTLIIQHADNNKVREQLVKSCLACLNLKPFHAPQRKKCVQQDNLTVSMIVN